MAAWSFPPPNKKSPIFVLDSYINRWDDSHHRNGTNEMNNLSAYITQLAEQIDAAGANSEADGLSEIADTLSGIAGAIKIIRAINVKGPEEFRTALDEDLEHLEALARREGARAEAVEDDIRTVDREEAMYGGYHDQVRDQYYGGVL